MASKDAIMAHRYAEEAKIAAATAKLYSKNNETYADEAADSAIEASGYADSASSYASISRQYYEYSGTLGQWNVGAYASAPTVRRDGSALQAGDLYKNTTDNQVYSYNSDGTWTSVSYDLQITRELYDAGEDLYEKGAALYSEGADLYEKGLQLYDASETMYGFSQQQSEITLTDAGIYENGPLKISNLRQIITYAGLKYYVNPSASLPLTTTGNTSTSWEVDKSNFIPWGADFFAQELYAYDGLKLVGQCPDLATLATIEPEYEGQVIDVTAYSSGWTAQAYGMPFGGGRFVYISALSSSKYTADGGTIVVTSGGKVWIREELYRSKQPKIYAEWFGCDGTFYTDDAAKINAAHSACLFWLQTGTISGAYAQGGVLGARAILVFPKQWSIASTVTVNQGYVQADFNNGIGLILSTGTYNAHQKLSGYSTAIDFNGAAISGSVDYVAAYYSNVIAKDGSLIVGTVKSNGQVSRATLSDSKLVIAEYRGSTESIRSAVGYIDNVTYSSGGVGYTNGDYGWGYTHRGSKFDNCYEPFYLVNGSDNGELIRHDNCMMLNCGTYGNLGDWTGDFQWIGGSWDYAKARGMYLGSSGRMTAVMTPGRIEYDPSVVQTLIDGSGSSRKCILSGTTLNFAVPSGATALNTVIFNSSYDLQFKLADSTIIDNSASGSLTKNYKITGDNRVAINNVSSLTLIDYFIAAGCVNAQGVADWQIVGASSYLTATKSITGNTLTITSSATAAVEQNIYIFVPLKDKRAFHQVTGMITATKPSVTISSYFGIGTVDSTGAIQTSYYIDSAGTAFSLQSGVTYPYGTYSSVTLAKSYTSVRGAAEDGMVIKLNCYNLISGSGSIVIDASRTGAITL